MGALNGIGTTLLFGECKRHANGRHIATRQFVFVICIYLPVIPFYSTRIFGSMMAPQRLFH